MACFLPVELVIACEEGHYVVDLLAGFAAQLDDKMWCLWMEGANIECHSLAAPDFLLFQNVDLSYPYRNKIRELRVYVNFLYNELRCRNKRNDVHRYLHD